MRTIKTFLIITLLLLLASCSNKQQLKIEVISTKEKAYVFTHFPYEPSDTVIVYYNHDYQQWTVDEDWYFLDTPHETISGVMYYKAIIK